MSERARAKTRKYPKELEDLFDMDRADTIGSGGFAKVKKAKHKITGEKVAIKIMDKAKLRETNDLERVAHEIEALKILNHQNISKLYFVHETDTHYYLVLEFAHGGELFDYIVARERCKEDEAREFFRQIVVAVAHCHKHGIAHRDLKPENLLLDKNSNIKLIDFGLIAKPANLYTDLLTTCCGSAAYAAPELIRGEKYIGPKADMWSLGILLYALLCGFLPFDDENTQRLYKLIQHGTYEIPPWMTPDSQKLIGQLLKHKPDSRLTMDKLLRHPWLLKGSGLEEIDPTSTCRPRDSVEPAVLAEMAKFYGEDVKKMQALILERKYDAITLNYELLLLRKEKGLSFKMPARRSSMDPTAARHMFAMANKPRQSSSPGNGGSKPAGVSPGPGALAHNILTKGKTRIDLGDPVPLSKEHRSNSVGIGAASGATSLDQVGKSDPADGSLAKQGRREGYGSHASNINAAGTSRPKSKSLFGSLGSLFGSRESLTQPRKIKALFNVKTTSTKSPDVVKAEVLRVLNEAGYDVKEKGYTITVKKFAPGSKTKVDMQIKFEVCTLDKVELTGIRLSRVKGDTWAYKKETDALLDQMKL
eukprot:m.53365 g.53365  ORF g.53365 m.53365 type:complete len:591 (+) comp7450_c0_seq1:309-2081(+)